MERGHDREGAHTGRVWAGTASPLATQSHPKGDVPNADWIVAGDAGAFAPMVRWQTMGT